MNDPHIGSYNIWDTVYGTRDKRERFTSGVIVGAERTLVAGEIAAPLPAGKESIDAWGVSPVKLWVVMLDKRGRVVWEKAHDVPGLTEVKKIIALPEGYMALGTLGGADSAGKIWIGFLDPLGEIVSDQTIADEKGPLVAHDLIRGVRKGEFLIAAAMREADGKSFHSIIYNIDAQANILWERAYMPGIDNKVFGLSITGPGRIAASGYIQGEDGRRNGWILKLGPEGSIDWQRQYPRGRASQLYKTVLYNQGYMAAVGAAYPFGEDERAGWVMLIDNFNGQILWQRYYTGKLGYEVRDIMIHPDGLLSAMMVAERNPQAPRTEQEPQDGPHAENPSEPGDTRLANTDFIRILTINPRGVLMASDEFFNGAAARAYQLIRGKKGERVLIGTTEMNYQMEKTLTPVQPVQPRVKTYEGWVVAGSQADTYKDPCAKPKPSSPKD